MLPTDSLVGSLKAFIFLIEAELNGFDHIRTIGQKKKKRKKDSQRKL